MLQIHKDQCTQKAFGMQGRKKNTGEGGTSVGSVAAAVAAASQSRKAPKQMMDFYNFQARDRRRNSMSLHALLFCQLLICICTSINIG